MGSGGIQCCWKEEALLLAFNTVQIVNVTNNGTGRESRAQKGHTAKMKLFSFVLRISCKKAKDTTVL